MSEILNEVNRRKKYSGDTEVFKERGNNRNEREIESARSHGLPATNNNENDKTQLDA